MEGLNRSSREKQDENIMKVALIASIVGAIIAFVPPNEVTALNTIGLGLIPVASVLAVLSFLMARDMQKHVSDNFLLTATQFTGSVAYLLKFYRKPIFPLTTYAVVFGMVIPIVLGIFCTLKYERK